MSTQFGLLDFEADELRLQVEVGSTMLVDLPVLDEETETPIDLTDYTATSNIYDAPIVSFAVAKASNVVSISLSQSDIESLASAGSSFNYDVWIEKVGERRKICKGALVIIES